MGGYDDGNEKREREIWGIIFLATAEQCREIMERKDKLPQFRRWAVVDYLVKCGKFDAFDPKAVALCEELVDLDAAVRRGMCKIVADITCQDA